MSEEEKLEYVKENNIEIDETERERLQTAFHVNTTDLDLCEWNHKTYINYLTVPEYEYPPHGLSVTGSTDTSITVSKNMSLSSASQIQDVVVHVGRNTFNLGNNESIECTGLSQDTEYEVYFEYVVVAPNGAKFNLQSDVYTAKTKAFKLPTIANFAESRKGTSSLSLSYEYIDFYLKVLTTLLLNSCLL